MKFYLSSYKMGNEVEKFKALMPGLNKRLGYVPDALDFLSADPKRREEGIIKEMGDLQSLGFNVERLHLKDYFGRKKDLESKLSQLGGVFVRGGNTFVLREAMKLSGFDNAIKKMIKKDFLYSGYSAGICVLAPSLEGLETMDHPEDSPYKDIQKTIWKGLGILDYMIVPHYKSDHPESADADKTIELYKKKNIKFKTLRDGEAIIIE